MPNKIIEGLKEAIDGRFAKTTTYIVTDIRTAQRMGRMGYAYVWEMNGSRPTGRCIVTMPTEPTPPKER